MMCDFTNDGTNIWSLGDATTIEDWDYAWINFYNVIIVER